MDADERVSSTSSALKGNKAKLDRIAVGPALSRRVLHRSARDLDCPTWRERELILTIIGQPS